MFLDCDNDFLIVIIFNFGDGDTLDGNMDLQQDLQKVQSALVCDICVNSTTIIFCIRMAIPSGTIKPTMTQVSPIRRETNNQDRNHKQKIAVLITGETRALPFIIPNQDYYYLH